MRILYIDIDSLRPDHLGCMGYHRNTSPNIDRLASESVMFRRCYTPDAPCLPSRTAFYSGRFGIQTGVVGHGGSAAQPKIEGPDRGFRCMYDLQGLAHQLQKKGMHTAMISSFGQRHGAWWIYAGFNEIHNNGLRGGESVEHVDPLMFPWLDRNARKDNWYLHVNYWDPHTPYRVPVEYGDPFKNDPLPKWLDDDELIARHQKMPGPHTALDIGMYDDEVPAGKPRHLGRVTDRASMRRMIDGYDTAIRYVDDSIGRLVQSLKDAGVYDDTAIIISSDHGENLGELGIYAEHATADDITCRVPMIIKWPGGKEGIVDDGLHYNLDLAPTLADLVGFPKCDIWDGQSFAKTIMNGASAGRDELILSQCAHVCQRSVRWDRWLYMHTIHDGFHLFPQEMLFDIEADPHEQNDLATKLPEVCREGGSRLMRWHEEQMKKMSGEKVDPLWTVMKEGGPLHAQHGGKKSPLAKYCERLEKTGRADGAAALREKYRSFLA